MRMKTFRTCFVALFAVLGFAFAAHASTFSVSHSTSGTITTFTITRSNTNIAEIVRYRTASRSALAGVHFMDNVGRLSFAVGDRSKSVPVDECTTEQIHDPRFLYYMAGSAAGNSRIYRFEVVDDGGFTLAFADRTISYDSSKSLSVPHIVRSVTVTDGEITVKDSGFAQAYHAVPLDDYFSSGAAQEYLVASGASLRMLLDLQAAEVDDGYQYIQILVNQTSSCDAATSGSDNGDPGTIRYSRYMAGFEHKHGAKDTNFKGYTFPVVLTSDNNSATLPWNIEQGNDIGKLCMQRFNTNCRAADGRLVVPADVSSLGIRFTASGSGSDTWTAKSIVARIQAVPSNPSLIYSDRLVVTPAPVCKGATVSISLPFNQIMSVLGTPILSTTWGDLPYVAGSGMNVITFAGPVTAAVGTELRITGLSGTVKGLTHIEFNWPETITISGHTVETLPVPPRVGTIYQLSSPLHLRWFANQLATSPDTSAALVDDIDLSTIDNFVPMGGNAGFTGTFDGRGHTLSNLSISEPDASGRLGLFGLIAAQGVVTNLVLNNVMVSSSYPPALLGTVCGRNLGTVTFCTVSGKIATTPRYADGTGSAIGGICGENAGTIRACCVKDALASNIRTLDNGWSNIVLGGIAGTNAVSGTIEDCLFYARYVNDSSGVVSGAVCGSNAGTVRICVGVHSNNNNFNGSIGLNSGTVENVLFQEVGADFTGGAVCYMLNNSVTDGSQPWYQAIGSDAIPRLSATPLPDATVYPHGNIYCNKFDHSGPTTWERSPDYSNSTWTVICDICGETNTLTIAGTPTVTLPPTCTNPGQTTWTYNPSENIYGVTAATNAVQHGVPAPLGHDWGAPAWSWNDDRTAATATFTCSRGDAEEPVVATVSRVPDGTNLVCTATATHHGETFTDTTSLSLWKLLQKQLNAGGTVTFTSDVTAVEGDSSLVVTNTVVLDLNGHMLKHNGNGQVLSVVGVRGDLTITNSLAAGAVTGGGDHGVHVGREAVFRLRGGAIAGNESNYAGGGVFVDVLGRFEMYGGSITNNAVSGGLNSGGGVYIAEYGKFIMSGGEISGNTAECGGGIAMGDSQAFSVSGCSVVSGNTNAAGAANNVYVASGHEIVVNGLSSGALIGVTTEDKPTASSSVSFALGASTGDEAYVFSDVSGFLVGRERGALYLLLPWHLLQVQLNAGGTVTLTNDVTALDGNATLTVKNAVTLDLNGHTLDADGRVGAIKVLFGGSLTLTNSVEGAGAITGGVASEGGGVYVARGGAFTMNGGEISGNSASSNGGGVCIEEGGAFTMNGGEISGNSASSNGGGVYIEEGGAFTMNGGEISGNTADSSGGGVYMDRNCVFMVSGRPVVSCNTNSAGTANNVYLRSGCLMAVNGLSTGASIGVTTESTPASPITFATVAALSDEAYFFSDVSDYIVECVNDTLRLRLPPTAWELFQVQLNAGGTVTLTNDVTATDRDSMLTITNAVTLDLNGHTIDAAKRFRVIEIGNGGNLTLTNSLAVGAVTGGGDHGVYVGSNAVFRLRCGAIAGNASNNAGGGVYVGRFGTFEMSGGSITNNAVSGDNKSGGGVYVANDGTFMMNGGEISGNSASSNGGGVYLNQNCVFMVSGSPVVSCNTNSAGAANNVYLRSRCLIALNGLSTGASIGVTTESTTTSPIAFATGASADDEAYFFSDVFDYVVECVNYALRLRRRPDTPWKLLQMQLDAGGTVTLTNDVTVTHHDNAALTIVTAVTLDLNGYTIDAAGKFGAIKVASGGNLTLTNSVNGAGAIIGGIGGNASKGGCVNVENGGVFTMNGGGISGNKSTADGGGVCVNSGGVFTMNGGKISGNSVSSNGGGVYVSNGGAFTMNGGEISGNKSTADGGGVYVSNGGAFTMSGGEISGNSASSNGGGVYTEEGGAFTMSGGEISGNSGNVGGGVYISQGGMFAMSGGVISGNHSTGYYCGGVYVSEGGTFAVSGSPVVSNNVNRAGTTNNVFLCRECMITVNGLSAGASIGVTTLTRPTALLSITLATGASVGDETYFTSDNPLFAVDAENGELRLGKILTPWDLVQRQLADGGIVVLTNDVTATDNDLPLTVANVVTLDLNGHTLTRGGNGEGSVFNILSGGDFTLTNSVDGAGAVKNGGDFGLCVGSNAVFRLQGGVITKTASYNFCSGVVVDQFGTFEMSGGEVSGNTSYEFGGGVNVYGGVFTMTGGKISGNTTDRYGGGVFVVEGGVFTMTGGEISGNTAMHGGGVCVYGGGSTFTMTGGEISGNAIDGEGGGVLVYMGSFTMCGGEIFGNNAPYYGGGVCVYGGAFTMCGGEISGNTADYFGGGVGVIGSTFTVSGSPVVLGNTTSSGVVDNVFLFTDDTITVEGLSEGASIGVTTYVAPTVSSPVTFTTGASADDEAYFTSDKSVFVIDATNDELRLRKAATPWDLLQEQLDAGGTVTLTNSITALDGDSSLMVTNRVVLDLAGHTLTAAGLISVIQILAGGDLTLTNSVDSSGAITGGNAINDGGGVHVNGGGVFTMNGGEISGNKSATEGGGVCVNSSGVFTMNGGKISGNTTDRYSGGGVYVSNGGVFAMNGGEISGNTAMHGGGVAVYGSIAISGSPVVSGNTNSVGAVNNVFLANRNPVAVSGLSAGASIGVTTSVNPTATTPVTFATGASAGDAAYFFSDIFGRHVEQDGSNLRLVLGAGSPTYLEGADEQMKAKYDAWSAQYGADGNSAYETAFLLNVAPSAAPAELRIDGIDVSADGAATIRVVATAGGEAVDMSKINGILVVAMGDDLGALVPKAIPAANVTYDNGAAVIAVPASAGRFIKARIDIAAPAESL